MERNSDVLEAGVLIMRHGVVMQTYQELQHCETTVCVLVGTTGLHETHLICNVTEKNYPTKLKTATSLIG